MDFPYEDSKCVSAKNKLRKNKTISDIWRIHFSPSNKIGNCTDLYRKLKPETTKDFFEKYVKYAQENKGLKIRHRGLTMEELIETAEKYKKLSEEATMAKYDLSIYYYDMLCHIITETYYGQHRESEFSDFLEGLGYKCGKFEGWVDTRYGVDIKVTKSNGKESAIQIKPATFFYSNRYDVQKDRINLCVKYEEAVKDLGIKTYYAIYTNDEQTGETLWLKNGDGFRFKINELFDYDKNDIVGTFTRKTLPQHYEKLC